MRKAFFLPVNTGYFEDGHPTEECLRFYADRSNTQTYCSIVGNIVSKAGFGSNPYTGQLSESSLWKKLSGSIRERGTKPGIQLANSWQGYVGQREFVNEDWSGYMSGVREYLKDVRLEEIYSYFCNSIDLALDNGFEHIQIHAAHGYLLSSLLDPAIYEQADAVVQVLDRIGQYLECRVESSIRLSSYCGLEGESEASRMHIIRKVISLNYDYFDLSEGYYNHDKNLIYPKTELMQSARLQRCLNIVNDYPGKQFILSGIWKTSLQLPVNAHLGFCRNIIANPNFMINQEPSCMLCGVCHYHSKGLKSLTCSLWRGRGADASRLS